MTTDPPQAQDGGQSRPSAPRPEETDAMGARWAALRVDRDAAQADRDAARADVRTLIAAIDAWRKGWSPDRDNLLVDALFSLPVRAYDGTRPFPSGAAPLTPEGIFEPIVFGTAGRAVVTVDGNGVVALAADLTLAESRTALAEITRQLWLARREARTMAPAPAPPTRSTR
jgi:hypothetical protein